MLKKNFMDVIHAFSSALVDDFRGFLENGVTRVIVPHDKLHLEIAYQKLLNVSGWKYESSVGQNPVVDYMLIKNSIYITKIPYKNGGFQRTVGFLTDCYNEVINYKGKSMLQYEVLRMIAIGMGYDVDEYTLNKESSSLVKNPVSIVTYKGKLIVSKANHFQPSRTLSSGDLPVFCSDGSLFGFISNGKFVNVRNYYRYASLSNHKTK